jgi:hypothetical protein
MFGGVFPVLTQKLLFFDPIGMQNGQSPLLFENVFDRSAIFTYLGLLGQP